MTIEARRVQSTGRKTWPDSGTISKTPREVLPLLGFISPGDEPVNDKETRGGALFISPLGTFFDVNDGLLGREKGQHYV